MIDIEYEHFTDLKKAVQDKHLENYSPSYDDISKWKGIDIIYFQEDLRQKAKGNISEKTFYTYFKKNTEQKVPRIDMLNILSIYSGYSSWSDFKKKNPIETKIEEKAIEIETIEVPKQINIDTIKSETAKSDVITVVETEQKPLASSKVNFVKKYLWLGISIFLFALVLFLVFYDNLFYKQYIFAFTDADRNSTIKGKLDVKILRENESPILFEVAPNSPFIYSTKNKSLKMVISSPFYKTDTVVRDLTNASEKENIELKPNDYAIQLYYYSKSIKDFKKKTVELNKLISDNALIYQVFDSDIYGIETMDKQKYISLVTLPTTTLENLEVIDSQMKNGKIVMIKFKITKNESSN